MLITNDSAALTWVEDALKKTVPYSFAPYEFKLFGANCIVDKMLVELQETYRVPDGLGWPALIEFELRDRSGKAIGPLRETRDDPGWLLAASCTYTNKAGQQVTTPNLQANANVSLRFDNGVSMLGVKEITLAAPNAGSSVRFDFKLRCIEDSSGGLAYSLKGRSSDLILIALNELFAGKTTKAEDAKRIQKVAGTVLHEIGHLLKMAPGGGQYSVDKSPEFYSDNDSVKYVDGHQGPHCKTGSDKTPLGEVTPGTCLMWGGTDRRDYIFCPHCAAALRKEDYGRPLIPHGPIFKAINEHHYTAQLSPAAS